MAENDFGNTLGIQMLESQDTRAQFGTGDTSVWEENYSQKVKFNTQNIIARKVYTGSVFTLGLHNLGSFHPYDTTERLVLGSFDVGTIESSGSIILDGGSESGSWISPILKYNFSEEYNSLGNVLDSGSSTWRYLTFDYGGSVSVDVYNEGLSGSYHTISSASGSEDMMNRLPLGSNIRLVFNIGSPTSFVGSIFQAFKPALLGSGTTLGPIICEAMIKQLLEETFVDTGSTNTTLTTGSVAAGSLELYPNTTFQSLSLTDDYTTALFDKFEINGTGSNFVGSLKYYASSDNGSNFVEINRGIERAITSNIGSMVVYKIENFQLSGIGSSVINDIDFIYKSTDY